MGIDIDGYGFMEGDRTTGRLVSDVRVLSPLGIERLAQGWDRHVGKHGESAIESWLAFTRRTCRP